MKPALLAALKWLALRGAVDGNLLQSPSRRVHR